MTEYEDVLKMLQGIPYDIVSFGDKYRLVELHLRTYPRLVLGFNDNELMFAKVDSITVFGTNATITKLEHSLNVVMLDDYMYKTGCILVSLEDNENDLE